MSIRKDDNRETRKKPKLSARMEEIYQVEQLVAQDRLTEALEIVDRIDRILSLPDEIDEATDRLLELLHDDDLVDFCRASTPKGLAGISLRFWLEGSLVPYLMEMRGRCLIRQFAKIEQAHSGIDDMIADPRFHAHRARASFHVELSGRTCRESVPVMVQAGLLCHCLSNYELAVGILRKMTQLDPDNETARTVLAMSEERWLQVQELERGE